MATNDDHTHQIIRHEVMRQRESSVADMILLWERLDCELASIIGHVGFSTIYVRSVHLTRGKYPMLAASKGADFSNLRASLEQQAPHEATELNIALLTVFVDTLILLIGDPLTTTLLHSAWGDDAVNTTGKELQ
jgi:hypothetical protein